MTETEHEGRADANKGLAIYLSVVQFFLLLTWTVYAIYLPGLLESVGVEKRWAGWVLLGDQVLFACFDVAAGFMTDRAFRLYARIGGVVIATTAVSCIAFLALPWLPAIGAGPKVFLAVTALWVVGSAALRSPLFGLLARHAAKPAVPGLAGFALAGMGLAAALSPYLGVVLKGADPRLPFMVSSLALLLVAGGVVVAERRGVPPTPLQEAPPAAEVPISGFLITLFLAALAFQIAIFVNAGPRYLQDADKALLPWLMPVFWVTFSLVSVMVRQFGKQWGAARLFAAGGILGALGLGLTSLPGLYAAVAGYAIAGLGWGAVLPSAFGLAADCGRPSRVGGVTGILFAVLAATAFARIGLNLAGVPQQPELEPLLTATPPILWLLGGVLMLALHGARAKRIKAAAPTG